MNWKENLNPELVERVEKLQELAKADGFDIRVTSAYRSHAEQNKLYQQGRTTKGNIVTGARGGQSFHNFGLAIDFVFVVNGTIDYKRDDHLYNKIGAWAKKVNLFWGGDWKHPDRPHVQLVDNDFISKAQILFQKRNSLSDVWQAVESKPQAQEIGGAIPSGKTVDSKLPQTSPINIKFGDKGEQVTKLQNKLFFHALLEQKDIDADFGKVTLAAVKSFQRLNGLREDGICGNNTAKALSL